MAKNRSVHLVHEDFEPFFNAVSASAVVVQKFLHCFAQALLKLGTNPGLLELR